MERGERIRLEAIKVNMERHLKTIKHLLEEAKPPTRRTRKQSRARATEICKAIHAAGGTISREQLKVIARKHGMPFTAVGALYAGRYVQRKGKKISLGTLGREVTGPETRRRKKRSKLPTRSRIRRSESRAGK